MPLLCYLIKKIKVKLIYIANLEVIYIRCDYENNPKQKL